jgi:Mg-chelatase subunit ChlD
MGNSETKRFKYGCRAAALAALLVVGCYTDKTAHPKLSRPVPALTETSSAADTSLIEAERAVAILVDKSASMKADHKMDRAKAAVKSIIRRLSEHDAVAVMGFDQQPFLLSSVGKVSSVRDSAIRRIDLLYPSQQTRLGPALSLAHEQLLQVKCSERHIAAITDGEVWDAKAALSALLPELKGDNISLTIINLGRPSKLFDQYAKRKELVLVNAPGGGDLERIVAKDLGLP